mmetsp:Transcript_7792/g.14179  ORF Transcript_7792/g.14179 Transcript_7792/m.14179 type:complete len:100 (-) Transcript_7792:432-731(-)
MIMYKFKVNHFVRARFRLKQRDIYSRVETWTWKIQNLQSQSHHRAILQKRYLNRLKSVTPEKSEEVRLRIPWSCFAKSRPSVLRAGGPMAQSLHHGQDH